MNQVRYDDEMRRGEAVTTPLSDDVVYFVTDLLPSKSRNGWDQRYQKRKPNTQPSDMKLMTWQEDLSIRSQLNRA